MGCAFRARRHRTNLQGVTWRARLSAPQASGTAIPLGATSDLFFGLSTAVGYGTSDFVARQASQRLGHVHVLFYMELIGLVLLAPVAFVVERGGWSWSTAWLIVLGLGVLNTFCTLFLYRAFEYGVLSVVSPIASSYPAATAALAILFLNEFPGAYATAGIVFVLGGILLLSRARTHPSNEPPRNARVGIVSAFVAFAGYGVFYFALKYVVGSVGPVTVATVVRLVGVVLLLLLAAGGALRIRRLPRALWPHLSAMGVLDSLAFIAYDVGIVGGSVAIVGTLSGLFSAVTVGLAVAVLHERLTRTQLVGVAAIFTGVVLIAL